MAPTTKDQDSLEKGLKELNLTNEELNKFEKAFKDPEFLKLFEEYAKEVSDPKVKAETDQYLRQLEEQGRGEDVYGKGVVLVAPKPVLVLKSKVMAVKNAPEKASAAAGSRRDNLTVGQKVFINVCTSEKVERYTLKEAKDASGRSGQQLSIPITMGPVRQGTDKQGQPAAVYDLVVHPETVEFAARSGPVMNTLAETALDQVEAVSLSRLSHNWRRLSIRYKGTEGCAEPPVQCLRTGEGGDSIGGRLKPRADIHGADVPGAKAAPPLAAAGVPSSGNVGDAVATAKGPASRSTFSFGKPTKHDSGQRGSGRGPKQQPPEVEDPIQPGFRHEDGSVTPEWTLVHRGQADLAAAWGDAGRGLALDTQVPKELLVRVILPDVASAAGVDLDVGERRLTLQVPGKYRLDAALPYAVEESKGKAKFDKARKQLEVTLPVVPPPPPPPPPSSSLQQSASMSAAVQELPQPEPRPQLQPSAALEEVIGGVQAATNTSGPESATGESGCLTSTAPAEVKRDAVAVEGYGTSPRSSAGEERQREEVRKEVEEVVRKVEVGTEECASKMTENERKWRELHRARIAADTEVTAVAARTAAAVETSTMEEATFGGATAGVAVPEPEPTVLLQPRLRRDLAMELD